VGSAGATVWFVGQELMDVPLSRRRMSLRDKLGVLRDHRASVAGLGGVTALALLIPLANLVVMPIAVLGASLLYCDLVRLGEEPLAQ